MTQPSHASLSPGLALAGDVWRFRPGLVVAAAALMLARSLSEAATFVLIVPLLELAGVGTPGGGDGRLHQWLETGYAFLGVTPSVEAVLACFLAVIVVRAVIGYACAMTTARLGAGFIDHVRRRFYRALTRASWSHIAASRQSHDMQALTMQAESAGYAVSVLAGMLAAIFTVAAGTYIAFLASPWLTLTVLAAALAIAAPLTIFQRLGYRRGTAAWKAMQRLYDVLAARMDAFKLAKAFSIETPLEREFAATSVAYRDASVAVSENKARASLLTETGAAVVLAAFIYAGLRLFDAAGVEIVLLIAIFARLMPLVHGLQSSLHSLATMLPEYAELRDLEDKARAAEEVLPEPRVALPLHRSLVLRNVGFRYPSRDGRWALRGASLEIPAHSSTGIIGLSGAGKSTLADILAGLVAPSEGALVIDGVTIDDRSRPHWRCGVAYVPQDPSLIHDTIRANLRLGADDIPDAALWACLDLAQAGDLVRAMPDGLDTLVGDRGLRLSGGERQRLRLASAVLRKPQLLILDEATNALNPADEREIIGPLRALAGSTTIVMIAHRASSIDWTERIIVVERGRIVEAGLTERLIGTLALLPADARS